MLVSQLLSLFHIPLKNFAIMNIQELMSFFGSKHSKLFKASSNKLDHLIEIITS